MTAYHVMYTSDLTTFNPVVDSSGDIKKFPGNFDEDTPVLNQFRLPIHARYLKVLPVKWTKGIEMRIEPIGCFEPYRKYAMKTELCNHMELELLRLIKYKRVDGVVVVNEHKC